jgi:hypothetical protein
MFSLLVTVRIPSTVTGRNFIPALGAKGPSGRKPESWGIMESWYTRVVVLFIIVLVTGTMKTRERYTMTEDRRRDTLRQILSRLAHGIPA